MVMEVLLIHGVRFSWGIRNDYPTFSTFIDDSWNFDYINNYLQQIPDNNWHSWVITATSNKLVSIYMDGQRVINFYMNYMDTQSGYIYIGDYAESYAPYARFASLRIYDRVLSNAEIAALASEF